MSPNVSSTELRRLLGDIDDARLAAILALEPSLAEVEAAAARLNNADMEPREGWPVQGNAVEIVSIMTVGLEDDDR